MLVFIIALQKARLCVKGAHKMYAYCAARGVKTSQHGSLPLLIRTEEKLDALMAAGNANHVPDLALLGKTITGTERELPPVQPLFAFTGVVDSHHYMAALKQMPKIMVPLLRIKAVYPC